MKDILDLIYDMQTQSAVSENSIGMGTSIIKAKKDHAETEFSSVLEKDQEICFDNFMDSIDKCNDDLQRIAFKKGFAVGLTIMQEVIKYSDTKYDNPIKSLLEHIQ